MDNQLFWFVLSIIAVFLTGVASGIQFAGMRSKLQTKFLNEHLGSKRETELDKEFRAWCAARHPVRYYLFVR
ncbi:MAG: hypothetical protein RDU25_02950 [Patescibacteria group bacterium]|nr:hypothetical protein [Patescibacteria group bacterium]